MDRAELIFLLDNLESTAADLGLYPFVNAVTTAYTPGWAQEWTDEGIVEAINVLTSAIFGTE